MPKYNITQKIKSIDAYFRSHQVHIELGCSYVPPKEVEDSDDYQEYISGKCERDFIVYAGDIQDYDPSDTVKELEKAGWSFVKDETNCDYEAWRCPHCTARKGGE